MSKTIKMQPDKFKQMVQKQDEPKRPATLGEPTMSTDWDYHMLNKHKIKNFTKIQTTGKDPKTGKDIKQAFVNTPRLGQIFIPVREDFCGYYYIWILCLNEKTGQILFRANTGDLDFVTWDVPVESKMMSPDQLLASDIKSGKMVL